MKYLFNLLLTLIGQRPKGKPVRDLLSLITERKGGFKIQIERCSYVVHTPFKKEGAIPLNGTQKSVFQYLSSQHLIQPLEKKLTGWLKDDMRMEDTPVDEYGLCYFLRDFSSENHDSTVYLATIHNHDMRMILAIEQNGSTKDERGLSHISTLIKAVAECEDKNFGGYALLNPFGLMTNPEMVSKHLRKGNKSIYCFLVKH